MMNLWCVCVDLKYFSEYWVEWGCYGDVFCFEEVWDEGIMFFVFRCFEGWRMWVI